MPYIVLTPEQGKRYISSIRMSTSMKCAQSSFKINTMQQMNSPAFFHPEMTVDNLFEKVNLRIWTEKLRIAIARLTPIQQRRVYAYYFQGKTMREIAEDEGVGFTKFRNPLPPL